MKLTDFSPSVQAIYHAVQKWPEWKRNAMPPPIPEERERTTNYVYQLPPSTKE